MTIKQLIRLLKRWPRSAEVLINGTSFITIKGCSVNESNQWTIELTTISQDGDHSN